MKNAILLSLTFVLCCTKRDHYVLSRSKELDSEVTVYRIPHAPNDSAAITVKSGSRSDTIYVDQDERSLGAVEVIWDRTDRTLLLFVCSAIAPSIKIRFNLDAWRQLPWQHDALIADQVSRRYKPSPRDLDPYGGDRLRWLCSYQGAEQFDRIVKRSGGIRSLPNL